MYQYQDIQDTIVAISTPMGQGGIGIVRLSGGDAIAVAQKIFKSRDGRPVESYKTYTMHYGWVVRRDQDVEQVIDEVILSLMRAPHSYTTEDVVEISCHAGTASLKSILDLTLRQGARLAEPGEFTKRAFVHGRIDLTQAEAVLDIIQARTETFLRVSTHQLKGDLARELEEIRSHLTDVYIEIEAIVNFPEDDVDAQGREQLAVSIDADHHRINKLLATGDHGRILKEGIKIVLCGKPNVGKSSLLNVLLRQPRAIVSDIAGTTRDTIEEVAQIGGIPFQLVDTAGILEPRDLIEKEAVRRSHMYIQGADLVLLVLDASSGITAEDEVLFHQLPAERLLVVINKCDLLSQIDEEHVRSRFPAAGILKVSATTKLGIDALESAVVQSVWQGSSTRQEGVMLSNTRHIDALHKAGEALVSAQNLLRKQEALELVSEEIKRAVNFLDSITGRNIDQDLLDNIFSQFCIGK